MNGVQYSMVIREIPAYLFSQTTIDNVFNIWDGERCFGNICRYDDEPVAFWRCLEDPHLLVRRQ